MHPSLKHYTKFKTLLSTYRASDRALKVIQDLRLVLMLAPTAGGRNTVIRQLLKTGRYYFIVSDTTREPRMNNGVLEQNGREYWFRSEEEMLADLEVGEYLEAELLHNQQVSGISIRELEKARQKQKIAITDVDLEGVHNILKIKEDALAIMLLPASFEEWQNRIFGRGTMGEQEYLRRSKTALQIFEDGLKQDYYHFVINDDISHATATVDAIARHKANPQQDRGVELIHDLKHKLENKIESIQFS